MNSLIEALYLYAQEKRVPGRLWGVEYRRAVTGIEDGWEEFRLTLTGEQGEALDRLLTQEREIEHIEDEALLSAGVSIGLDLGRL